MPKLDEREVLFEALHGDTEIPVRATHGAAGYDLRAYLRNRLVQLSTVTGEILEIPVENELSIPPGARAAVPLGFKARLPIGMEAQLRLRSSAAFRKGLILPNAPATIDPDYPGEWLLLIANMLPLSVSLQHGERIAQVVFSRFEEITWIPGMVGPSSDRTGGLGSTG